MRATQPPIAVTVVLPSGDEVTAGHLRATNIRKTQSAAFQYAAEYLAHPGAYEIDPELPLVDWPQQSAHRALFRCMNDSTPDRWGRALLDREFALRAKAHGETRRQTLEIDYLLGVRDVGRQGALRYWDQDGEVLAANDDGVPKILDLATLLSLTEDILRDPLLPTDIHDLIAAGSSLGGARPKALIRDDDGNLLIAKFPKVTTDSWDVPAWEKLTLNLAAKCGISTPTNRLISVLQRNVLLENRFDRIGDMRIGYISAITLLQTDDGNHTNGFTYIADFLEPIAENPNHDLPELYRRALFGLLVSNTDNHLRNHGFLRGSSGWVLSPAYDLNPNPEAGVFATSVSSGSPQNDTLTDALEWSEYFRLSRSDALVMLGELLENVATWRQEALEIGIPKAEISLMKPAFESARYTEAIQLTRG